MWKVRRGGEEGGVVKLGYEGEEGVGGVIKERVER